MVMKLTKYRNSLIFIYIILFYCCIYNWTNIDQPLTQLPLNNPQASLSLGIEFVTSGQAFQVFPGNYQGIVPQSNNLFNKSDYENWDFLIGFNIARLWNL